MPIISYIKVEKICPECGGRVEMLDGFAEMHSRWQGSRLNICPGTNQPIDAEAVERTAYKYVRVYPPPAGS